MLVNALLNELFNVFPFLILKAHILLLRKIIVLLFESHGLFNGHNNARI